MVPLKLYTPCLEALSRQRPPSGPGRSLHVLCASWRRLLLHSAGIEPESLRLFASKVLKAGSCDLNPEGKVPLSRELPDKDRV